MRIQCSFMLIWLPTVLSEAFGEFSDVVRELSEGFRELSDVVRGLSEDFREALARG